MLPKTNVSVDREEKGITVDSVNLSIDISFFTPVTIFAILFFISGGANIIGFLKLQFECVDCFNCCSKKIVKGLK